MAPAAVPLTKLASLLIKTLAKPMAKQVKHQFVKQPLTRRFLIGVGQTAHGIITRMTIWSSGFKVRSISKLEEEAALSRGADLLSESFIFTVSMTIVIWEYNRSSESNKKKEAAKLQQIRHDASRLQAKLDSLDKRLMSLEDYAKANRRSIVLGIGVGANAEYQEPDSAGIVPIHDEEADEENTMNKEQKLPAKENEPSEKKKRRWWPF